MAGGQGIQIKVAEDDVQCLRRASSGLGTTVGEDMGARYPEADPFGRPVVVRAVRRSTVRLPDGSPLRSGPRLGSCAHDTIRHPACPAGSRRSDSTPRLLSATAR